MRDRSSFQYNPSHETCVASCSTPGTKLLSFAPRSSLEQEVHSSGVQARIPTSEECNHFRNWSTSTDHHAPARSLAFLPVLVFGCERKPGTIRLLGLMPLALPIHDQRCISISRASTNSRIRGIGIGLLSWPQPAAIHTRKGAQRERRMGTSGLA